MTYRSHSQATEQISFCSHSFSFCRFVTQIVTLVTSCVKGFSSYDSAVSKDANREAIASNVIRLLREEREARGLSMNVVAQRSGLSHSIVSLIERDLRNPTLDTLLRIAEAIEVDLGSIVTEAIKTASKQRRK